MPLLPSRKIRVQPYFGYRNGNRLTITARALRSRPPEFAAKGRWQAMRTMLAQFASHEVADLPVTLEIENAAGEAHRYDAVSDAEGFVHFDIALEGEWPLPAQTSWEVVALHWQDRDEEHCVEGHVLAPAGVANLGVISDIDDTIVETGITSGFNNLLRNWRRVMAELPDERLAVPGADTFYNALGGGTVIAKEDAHLGDRIPATHRPFFYVSSSPWNLFSYLVAFQKSRNLPLGPIMLRDWAFDSSTLGHESHGAHKRAAIEKIIKTYPDMRFALIGDDTQGDLPAFGDIAADNPGRIAAIFIRTAGELHSPEEIAAKATIQAIGIPLWLGESYDSGQEFLRQAGLAGEKEAERIVEVVDKAGGVASKGD